jgi:hypothetical protein
MRYDPVRCTSNVLRTSQAHSYPENPELPGIDKKGVINHGRIEWKQLAHSFIREYGQRR